MAINAASSSCLAGRISITRHANAGLAEASISG
jgi:hypothetical protein